MIFDKQTGAWKQLEKLMVKLGVKTITHRWISTQPGEPIFPTCEITLNAGCIYLELFARFLNAGCIHLEPFDRFLEKNFNRFPLSLDNNK